MNNFLWVPALPIRNESAYHKGAMKFTKMHGIGNDYVYVNGFEESIADPAAVSDCRCIGA